MSIQPTTLETSLLLLLNHIIERHMTLVRRVDRYLRREVVGPLIKTVGKRINYGRKIFDYDWDLLIVLDACRYDLFEEFAPQHPVYEEFESVEPVYSCSSATREWIERNITRSPDDIIRDTYYVSCTPFTDEIDMNRFNGYDETWRYATDPEWRGTRPDAITNASIDAIRNSGAKRIIAHYVQPHTPFVQNIEKYLAFEDGNAWQGLKHGHFDREEVWRDYGDNLLLVLDHVQTLIDNASGKVVVTSDHGNAMGEFGFYGHPPYVPHPTIKRVPWAVTHGKGADTFEVKSKSEFRTGNDQSVSEKLRELGYVS